MMPSLPTLKAAALSSGLIQLMFLMSITNAIAQTNPVFPPILPQSIDENSINTTVVIDIEATDGDGGLADAGITYAQTGGTGNTAFSIDAMGIITVIDVAQLDHEVTTTFDLDIEATDADGTTPLTVTINLNNLDDEDPVFENVGPFSIDENSIATTSVGIVDANNGDGGATDFGITYSITMGNTNVDGMNGPAFAINPGTGAITVDDPNDLDFETTTSFSLTVEIADGVNTNQMQVFVVNVNPLDDIAPIISDLSDADGDNFTFTEDDAATIIDGNTAADFSDLDLPADFSGTILTVTFSANGQNGEDVLSINDQGAGAGLVDVVASNIQYNNSALNVGSFVGGSTGVDLVITFTSNADDAAIDAILQQITYFNSNTGDPNESVTRTASFTFNDGTADSNQADVSIDVTRQNDAPVIDNSGTPAFTPILEDVAAPTGDLVSAIIAALTSYTDADGAVAEGIAVTAVDNSNGAWEWSIDNGSNWTAFSDDTPSVTDATLLASDAMTRIRFIPSADFNGTVDPGVTFQGWDQTDGNSNGDAGMAIDVSAPGSTDAFSSTIETASITITLVNDEPSFTLIASPDQMDDSSDGSQGPFSVINTVDLGPVDEDIGAGAPNEQAVMGYVLVNDNNSLFSAQPAISATGNLTYTIATNADGLATVDVQLQDDGGTAVAGDDDLSSVLQLSIDINDDEVPIPNTVNSLLNNALETSFDFVANVNENVTINWLVRDNNTGLPSTGDIDTGSGDDDIATGNFSYTGNGSDQTELISGLSQSTTYYFYWYAVDADGNMLATTTVDEGSIMTIADASAPSFVNSTPNTSSVAAYSMDLNVELDESGTVFYVYVLDGETAPSEAEIIAGTGFGGADVQANGSIIVGAANSPIAESVNFLPNSGTGTAFDIYLVTRDGGSNTGNRVGPENVTTPATSTPTNVVITAPAPPTTSLCIGDDFTAIGDVVIEEAATNMSAFVFQGSGVTMILTLPTGYEFNTGATITVTEDGNDDFVNGNEPALTAITLNSITISYEINNNMGGMQMPDVDDITISGLEVRATSAAISNIQVPMLRTGGTADITDLQSGSSVALAIFEVGNSNAPPNELSDAMGNAINLCDGDDATDIAALTTNNSNFEWYEEETLQTLVYDGGLVTNYDQLGFSVDGMDNFNASESKSFFVVDASAGGSCPSLPALVEISVNAIPVADAGGSGPNPDISVCTDEIVFLGGLPALVTPTVGGTYIYQWIVRQIDNDGDGPNPPVASGTAIETSSGTILGGINPGSNPSFIPPVNNTVNDIDYYYELQIFDPTGCPSLADVIVVRVHPQNNVSIVLNPNQATYDLNLGAIDLVLTPTAPNPLTASYSLSGSSISYDGLLYEFNTTSAGVNMHDITYAFTDTNNCESEVTTTIDVVSNTDIANLPANNCELDPTTIVSPTAQLLTEVATNLEFTPLVVQVLTQTFLRLEYRNETLLTPLGGNNFTFDPVTALASNGGQESSNSLRVIVLQSGNDFIFNGITFVPTPFINRVKFFKTSPISLTKNPTLSFDNLNAFHCADEGDIQLQVNFNSSLLDLANDNGTYEIKVQGTADASYLPIGGGLLDLVPLTDGQSYTIRYSSNSSNDSNGCTNIVVKDFELVGKPVVPLLSDESYAVQASTADFLAFNTAENTNAYHFVYCQPTDVELFYLEFADIDDNRVQDSDGDELFFRWFNEDGMTGTPDFSSERTFTGLTPADNRRATRFNLFEGGVATAGVHRFYVTQTVKRNPFVDVPFGGFTLPGGFIFAGCQSDPREIIIEILENNIEHNIVDGTDGTVLDLYNPIGGVQTIEYCVGDLITPNPISPIELNLTPALGTGPPDADGIIWTNIEEERNVLVSTTSSSVTMMALQGSNSPQPFQETVGTIEFSDLGGSSNLAFLQGRTMRSFDPSTTLTVSYDNANGPFTPGERVLIESGFEADVVNDDVANQILTIVNIEGPFEEGLEMEGLSSGNTASVVRIDPVTPLGRGRISGAAGSSFELRAPVGTLGMFDPGNLIIVPTTGYLAKIADFTSEDQLAPYRFLYSRRNGIGLLPNQGGGAFPGCDGPENQVDVYVYPIPLAPDEADDPLFDVDVFACAGDISLTLDFLLSPVASNPDVEYVWYDAASGGNEIGNGADRDDLRYQTLFDAGLGFNPNPLSTQTTPVYLAQITNRKNALTDNFQGCESTARTRVDVTVYAEPTEPVITAFDGGMNPLSTRTDGAPDITFTVCEGDIDPNYRFFAGPLDGSTSFRWYNSDELGVFDDVADLITTQLAPFASTLGLSGADAGIQYFAVSRITNIDVAEDFLGCTSPTTLVAVDITVIPGTPTTGQESYSVCLGDGLGDLSPILTAGTFNWYNVTTDQSGTGGPIAGLGFGLGLDVYTGTTPNGALNLGITSLAPIGDYTFLVTEIVGTEIINNTPGFDGCETPEGNGLEITIKITGPPSVSIEPFTGAGTGTNEFCIDDADIILRALTVSEGTGVWTSVNTDLSDAGITPSTNETAVFNFEDALQAIAMDDPASLNDRIGEYDVRYTYTDTNGCQNFDDAVIIIHLLPQPDFSIHRGNDPLMNLEASSNGAPDRQLDVCELDDLSVITAATVDKIVLLDRTDQAVYGTRMDATFRGRITSDGANIQFTDDAAFLENLNVGMDVFNDGEAYFYPRAAIDFAVTNDGTSDLSDNTFIDFEFNMVYTNNFGCTNDIPVPDRVTIRVYKEPLPDIDISIPQNDDAVEVCIDHDEFGVDGKIDDPIIFSNESIEFASTGGTIVYSGISLPSGMTISGTALVADIPNDEARFFPRQAYMEAEGFGDADGTAPATFEIIYTYTSDQGCINTTAEANDDVPFTMVVNPSPIADFTLDPVGQALFKLPEDLNTEIESGALSFPIFENDLGILSGGNQLLEFCEDAFTVDLDGIGFFVDLSNSINGGDGTYSSNNNGNFGLTSPPGTGGTFDPVSAWNVSGNTREHEVTFTFTDPAGCQAEVTKTIIINEKPTISLQEIGGCNGDFVEFTLDIVSIAPGDAVQFIVWDFEDGTDDDLITVGTELIQTYQYDGFGERNITVQVFTEKGCTSTEVTNDFFIGDIPNTNFNYEGLCADQPFAFEALPEAVNVGVVQNFTFDFKDGSPLVTVDLDDFPDPPTPDEQKKIPEEAFEVSHTFPIAGVYNVELSVTTTNGCTSTHPRQVPVLPTIVVTPDNPYIETFEGVAEVIEIPTGTDSDGNIIFDILYVDGWVPDIRPLDNRDDFISIDGKEGASVASRRVAANTWQFGTVNGTIIGEGANGSANAWVTNLDGPFADNEGNAELDDVNGDAIEVGSWVFTPCFDISALDQPMIRFQRIFDFGDQRDGAVLEYSVDNGLTWTVLGDNISEGVNGEGTGLNWYNEAGIQGRPGDQVIGGITNLVGWGGGVSSGTNEWVEARHKLDEIPSANGERQRVIFRFAIGAQSGENTDNEGFGIDDFIIEERSKKVFVEHYSGSFSSDDGVSLGIQIDELRQTLEDDVHLSSGDLINNDDAVLVTYKTDIAGPDPINTQNPADNNARVVFYGVESLPTTVVNGVGGNTTNTSTEQTGPFSQTIFNQSALPAPDITIDIQLDVAADDQVAITVNMVNQNNVVITDDVRLYIAIVEKTVEDGGILLRNVMRKLLPSGSGSALIVGEEGGAIEPVSQSWNIQRVEDGDNLAVVAWIQNTNTKSVVQAASVDIGDKGDIVTGIDDLILNSENINIYPNPANELVTVEFGLELDDDFDWALYNQVGQLIKNGLVRRGERQFDIQTTLFPSGLYFLRVGKEDRRFKHFKVVISH